MKTLEPVIAVGGGFEPCSAGSQDAILIRIEKLGMQSETYDGQTRQRDKIRLVFEVDELNSQGKRKTIGRKYTNSIGKGSALGNMLEAWRGKALTPKESLGFDVSSMIGVSCRLEVIEKVYENGPSALIDRVYPANVELQPEGELEVTEPEPKNWD